MDAELEHDLREHLIALEQSAPEPSGLADRVIATARADLDRSHFRIGGRWPGSRIWVSLGAAATVLALILGAAWIRSTRDSSVGGGEPSNEARTTAYVKKLLTRAPVLPGSTPVDRAPVDAVVGPFTSSGSQDLVERQKWWTAPGTVTAAISYFTAHPPAGWVVGSNASEIRESGTSSETLTYVSAGRYADYLPKQPDTDEQKYLASSQLSISVGPSGSGVAVVADAQGHWIPDRTAAETIPADATSADLTLTKAGSTPIRRTVTGGGLQDLARTVNAQSVSPQGFTCYGRQITTEGQLVFHAPGRADITMMVSYWMCSGVPVVVSGVPQPGLTGASVIYTQLLKVFGLPADYGR